MWLVLAEIFALALAIATGLVRPNTFGEYLALFGLLVFSVAIRDLRRVLIRRQIEWQAKRGFSLLRWARRKFNRAS